MRYRLMATYRGAPYEAGVGPADGSVVLFAACPPPEELGFEPATGHWRKELRIQDVQAVWQSRPVGRFRGERCVVLDDLGDRLHICYLGHDAFKAEQLGFWQVDRGVFELIAARDEVTDIIEERSDYPGRPGPDQRSDYPSLPSAADLSYERPPASQTGPGYLYPAGSAAAAARMLPPHGGGHAPPPGNAVPPGPGSALSPGPGSPLPPGNVLPGRGPVPPGSALAPGRSEVSLPPPAAEPPLPLEAEAMRAASAAARREQPAPAGAPAGPGAVPVGPSASGPGVSSPGVSSPGVSGPGVSGPLLNGPGPNGPAAPGAVPSGQLHQGLMPQGPPSSASVPPGSIAPPPGRVPPPAPPMGPPGSPSLHAAPVAAPDGRSDSPRRRRAAGRRMATERLFSELASQAAIPAGAYSVGEEVDGAMCLLETPEGFEVFSSAGGARHEVRVFSDEESACFYLFGVLAAEAVRTGVLVPSGGRVPAGAPEGALRG